MSEPEPSGDGVGGTPRDTVEGLGSGEVGDGSPGFPSRKVEVSGLMETVRSGLGRSG